MPASEPTRRDTWLLAIAAAVAFSPAALDWLALWLREPWTRYSLTFALLLPVAARREAPIEAADRPSGLGWIVLGLAIELLAALNGTIRWGQPGLAFALFGILQRGGLASWRSASLIFLALPAPAFLLRGGSAALVDTLLPFVAASLDPLGLALPDFPTQARIGDNRILLLAPLLGGLAWYGACLFRLSSARAVAASLFAMLGIVPLVALALCGALLAVSAGWEAERANGFLRGSWLVAAGAGVAWIEWQWRRQPVGRAGDA